MNIELLRAIANASAANTVVYVSAEDGLPLLKDGLISVDQSLKDPNDANKIGASITEVGVKYLHDNANHEQAHGRPMASFAVQSGVILPKTTRKSGGGAGAPTKYPFATMEIGQFFFVANSEVDKGDAVKTLSSAAGSANQRFAIETGQMKTVQRAKRGEGNKAIKGPDGKNLMETVTIPVKVMTKKFVVRPVKAGTQLSATMVAPADGAVVARVELKPNEEAA